MSMKEAKEQLNSILEDHDNKVLALSGTWGTGKTHLLREVRRESTDEQVKSSLYVSLFGLRGMSELKLKLVQCAIHKADEKSKGWRAIGGGVKAARKVLLSIHEGFSALDELALLAVPSILKEKVVVLDDIERKHADLGVDEVLGFIDEFTQLHEARFVLVMNSDQLEDQTSWETLREKVVDQEIRLNTSPAEAFGIAIGLNPSPYADAIKKSVEVCELTNIRVIRKIIKVVDRIIGHRPGLHEEIISRVVPSTVLLTAIHYRGLDGGPTFEYVLAAGGPSLNDLDDKAQADDRSRAGWDLLLTELGIISSDEYELLVVELLQSGLFNAEAVSRVIDRYVNQHDASTARTSARAFMERAIWDHRLSEPALVDQARTLKQSVHHLDASFVTALSVEVARLAGGKSCADELIDEWIAHLPADFHGDPDDQFFLERPLHPRIKALMTERAQETQADTTVFDAVKFLFEHNGWGVRQETTLKLASAEDFERTI